MEGRENEDKEIERQDERRKKRKMKVCCKEWMRLSSFLNLQFRSKTKSVKKYN